MDITRGDVVLVVAPKKYGGGYGKPRPAAVVQSNLFNATYASVVVCPITSDDLLDMTEGLDSRIFTAVDALLYPSYTLGCHGAICALLTAVPDYGVEQWNATKSGDDARALTIHKLILRLWNAVRGDNLPANIKTVLRLRGRTPGYCRAPMSPSSRSVESDIKQALTYLGHQPLKAVGGGVEKPPARPPPSLSLERQ